MNRWALGMFLFSMSFLLIDITFPSSSFFWILPGWFADIFWGSSAVMWGYDAFRIDEDAKPKLKHRDDDWRQYT